MPITFRDMIDNPNVYEEKAIKHIALNERQFAGYSLDNENNETIGLVSGVFIPEYCADLQNCLIEYTKTAETGIFYSWRDGVDVDPHTRTVRMTTN